MSETKTYNPKKVLVTLGEHRVTGYAEDSFISIAQKQDGVTSKTGCDGEVVRSIDPSKQYTVNLTLLLTSKSNQWLRNQYNRDKEEGDAIFPVLVKDLAGNIMFSANDCWVVRQPDSAYGREAGNREWALETGEGSFGDYQ